MVRRWLIFSGLLFCLVQVVNSQQTYEEWLRQQRKEYAQFKQEVTKQYKDFVRADSIAYAQFRHEVEQKWKEFVGSTYKAWVEYGDDLNSRSVVDFEEGEAKVEVIITEEETKSQPGLAIEKLTKAVVKLVTDKGKTMDYEVKNQRPRPLGPRPVLEGQLKDKRGELVTAKKALSFAKEVVIRKKNEVFLSKDGVRRVKLAVKFSLVPGHLRIRAQRYLETVMSNAQKYKLDPRLVFATIHTESYFNPKARSHAPAFGLMQLVPTSGAREAYIFIYKDDKVLSPNYLYDPQNNIELGCAYLHILGYRYFGDLNDSDSRRYCMVSAYNTGPGNVSRAIVGSRKVNRAIERINKMESKKVFQKLKRDLPYKETRDYLVKVDERMNLYNECTE
jgi:membrane-bound lytic murein transglycosylase C